jgi:CRISPR-associated protein Cmr1
MRRTSTAPAALPEHPDSCGESVWPLSVKALTPIYKGGANPDGIDHGRPFRGPSIRGQLRYWWRATSNETNTDALRSAERALFGGVFKDDSTGQDKPVASLVRVGITHGSSTPEPRPPAQEFNYVLWVDRSRGGNVFHGAGANARLRVSCPQEHANEVKRALKAWLLLGGVGSRSRRGCGAVWFSGAPTVLAAPSGGRDLAMLVRSLMPQGSRREWPTLAGGWMASGARQRSAMAAWKECVKAMQSLRARHPKNRPIPNTQPPPALIADYPTIRDGRGTLHSQRAALGLPIPFRWLGAGPSPRTLEPQNDNRTPSPILMRPVPTADGGFLPMMVGLRVPYPRLKLTSRPEVRGTVDASGVDTFMGAVDRLPGWNSQRL